MAKFLVVAQKDGKKKVAVVEPKHLTITELQNHLLTLGVAITFKELSGNKETDGLVFKDLAGTLAKDEVQLQNLTEGEFKI